MPAFEVTIHPRDEASAPRAALDAIPAPALSSIPTSAVPRPIADVRELSPLTETR